GLRPWSSLVLLCRRRLDDALVVGQCLAPEPIELGTQLSDPIRIQVVDAAGSVAPIAHEASVLEHLQMLRDGRPADRQPGGELPDGTRSCRETLEDRAARWIAQGPDRVRCADRLGGSHLSFR